MFSSNIPNGVRRLFRLPTRARLLHEVDEEVRIHFEMRVTELRALGMSETDAQTEAFRRFGARCPTTFPGGRTEMAEGSQGVQPTGE